MVRRGVTTFPARSSHCTINQPRFHLLSARADWRATHPDETPSANRWHYHGATIDDQWAAAACAVLCVAPCRVTPPTAAGDWNCYQWLLKREQRVLLLPTLPLRRKFGAFPTLVNEMSKKLKNVTTVTICPRTPLEARDLARSQSDLRPLVSQRRSVPPSSDTTAVSHSLVAVAAS